MKISRNNTKATAIALLLMLTIAATLVVLPVANAHTPKWDIPTWAYLSVTPNPVGVDQTALVVMWLTLVPPTASGVGGDRWRGFTIEVTKPDGTKEALGPFTSDPVGSTWTLYTPDQIGTYSFVFKFPGQVLSRYGPTGIVGGTSAYENDTFLSSSATASLTVQQAPIAPVPIYPLPTEYWTRPIEGQNEEWYKVSSNWLRGAHEMGNLRFQEDGIAPNSPHIMWTKPLLFGGVVGGTNIGGNGMTFYDGSQYESQFQNVIIMYGRLYYPLPLSHASSGGGYVCVDLRTGEQLWYQNFTAVGLSNPSFGQFYDYESMNQHGVIQNGYLWTSNFGNAIDPMTGLRLFNMTGVPSGTEVYGPSGEIVRYVLNVAGKWLALWNSTASPNLMANPGSTSFDGFEWRPMGRYINASNGYSWNVTIPTSIPTGSSIQAVIPNDILLGRAGTLPSLSSQAPYTYWAISLKPNSIGQLLWMNNYSPPPGNITLVSESAAEGVWIMEYKETMQWLGYDMYTGNLLWGPTAPESAFGYYSATTGGMTTNSIAYGKFYSTGYSGNVYCYDLKNGTLLWTYKTNSGLNNAYGEYPMDLGCIADGKIYLGTHEHSANAPHWKGARVRCVDTDTGKEVWSLMGWGAAFSSTTADGYLVYLNLYDNQIYCIGKGPSATTVTVPDTAQPLGTSVVIKGTVIDKTPAAKGAAAMSDASMSQWMEYLYMQKPIPTNATGVEVTLDTIDPNGNFVHIGTATSDMSGLFSYMWTPEVPGKYTIIATFAGSESYWSSYAETAIGVLEAPPAPAQPEPAAPLPPYEMYTLYATIAIIIAIAIVGLMLLRKRP